MSTPNVYSAENMRRDAMIMVLYFFTSLIAVIGNIFVCATIRKKNRLTSTTYLLIYNMAISDIIGGSVIPGQWLFCWTRVLDSGRFGQILCWSMKILQILSYYVSSLTMAAIAYDRYKLVCRPMDKRFNAKHMIIFIWIAGIIFILTATFNVRVSEYFSPKALQTCRLIFPVTSSLTFRKFRAATLILTQYLIPLVLTIIFYTLVMRKVYSREQIAGTGDNDKRAQFDERKRQTIIMLMFVTILFGLSYLPSHTYLYMMFFTKIIPQTSNSCYASTAYSLVYWLGISSCAYNPFIYCYFNAEFRMEAVRYWKIVRTLGTEHVSEVETDKYGLGTSVTDTTNVQVITPQSSANNSQDNNNNNHNNNNPNNQQVMQTQV